VAITSPAVVLSVDRPGERLETGEVLTTPGSLMYG